MFTFFLIFLVFELTTLGTVIGGPKTDLQIEKLLKVLPTVKHSSSSDSLGVVCPEGMKDIGAGVWMMPPPSHDPDFQWLYLEEKGVPLFVRECVRTLCDEILLPSLASGKKKGFVVTGTPGIGKSVLTNWLVACSLSLFPDRPIILHDWQNPKFMRLITKDGSVRVIDDDWFVMNDKKLVYLADTGGRQPRDQLIHAGFAVVTASPAAAPKEFLKHSTSVRTLLPPWTQEECEAVFRAIQAMEPPPERYFPSRDEFERRFKFAGGIPRCLFGPQELSDRYEEGVNNAISNLDSTQRMDANFDMRDVIHKLLHIHPKDPQEAEAGKKWDFIHLSYDFPTEDVQERISTKIQELNKIDAQRSLAWFLGSGLKFPSMRILVGNYFKKCAHDIISSSNDSSSKKHTIQQLLDTTTSTAATTTTTSVQFLVSKKDFCSSFLESDLEEGVYYQPTSSNHPVADSWLVQTEEEENGGCGQKIVVYLFQMTVQSSGHPLKGKKLTSFVKHCLSKFSPTGGRCIIRLVFVIPTQQTRHYERLQQATAGSSPLPSEVEQWKMEIYLPELNGKSFP